MAVQQFLLFDEDENAVAAVASDGETAVTVFSDAFEGDDELRDSLAANFELKVDQAKELDGWPLMEVLRYNLYYLTGPVEEYDDYDAAKNAAQEAFA
jgi:hypothetical protein